ncbi:MAG: hypothetical protein JWL69_3882 [Phycisphaerales bacterium]|nr:hypothetical protein [Phycisphaerales bacterium]
MGTIIHINRGERKESQATGFAIRFVLPFRMRLGEFYSFRDEETGHELFVKNRRKLDGPTIPLDDLNAQWEFLSEAIVVVDVNSIGYKPGNPKGKKVLDFFEKAIAESFRLFNEHLVADWQVLPSREVLSTEAFDTPLTFIGWGELSAILILFDEYDTGEKIEQLFDWPELDDKHYVGGKSPPPGWQRRKFGAISVLLPTLPDVAPSEINRIPYCFQLQRKEIFYEFLLEAFYERVPRKRLLWAWLALEAAHSSLVRLRLAKKSNSLMTKEIETITDEFLGAHGIFKSIGLTQYAFLEEAERPPQQMIKNALEGIQARNAIMHARRTKKGEFKLRADEDDASMYLHAQNIVKLVTHFRKILEAEYWAMDALRPEESKCGNTAKSLANE